ncbi:MAG: DUF4364 family protein [Oscillospiraceae bacterium]|nr:DUF4364 family protein [Oscillospiraceae bacterium]
MVIKMKIPALPKIVFKDEPKIITIVCFLLENIGTLKESELLEIVTVDGMVPQFKLSDTLTIIENKELALLTPKGYTITEKGKEWLSQFENTLAATLRRKLLSIGKEVARLANLRKTARWQVSQTEGEWVFYACFLNEVDGSRFIEIKFYSKTEKGALKAQEKFLKDPAKAFSETISNFI